MTAIITRRLVSVPEPAGPDWKTEDEALRAGVERGRYLVDKRVDDD